MRAEPHVGVGHPPCRVVAGDAVLSPTLQVPVQLASVLGVV